MDLRKMMPPVDLGPVFLLTAAALFTIASSSVIQNEPLEEIERTAMFHLEGFKKSIDELHVRQERSFSGARVEARSVKVEDVLRRIASHMLAFCKELDVADGTSATTNASTVPDISDDSHVAMLEGDGVVISYERLVVDASSGSSENGSDSNWFLPELRPIEVTAERIGDAVRVLFDVIHSGPGVVARVESFNFARVEIDIPSNQSGTFVSKIQFIANVSACHDDNDGFRFQELYDFLRRNTDGQLEWISNVKVDVCGFDKYKDMSLGYPDRAWETRSGPVEEDIEFPQFQILQEEDNNFTIGNGENATFLVQIVMDTNTYLFVFAKAYGHNTENWYKYSKVISFDGVPEGLPQIHGGGSVDIFYIEVINQTFFTTPSAVVDESDDWHVNLTLRITLPEGSEPMSGTLGMSVGESAPNYHIRSVVRRVQMIKRWSFRGYAYPPPTNAPEFRTRNIIRCQTDRGNAYQTTGRRNCVVTCSAYGQGITDISIFPATQGSESTPSRSVSYVLGKYAVSLFDAGPASAHASDSQYVCVLQSASGRQQIDISLVTSS